MFRAVGGKEEERPGQGSEQSQDFGGGNYILETPGGEAQEAEGSRGPEILGSRKIGLCRKREFQVSFRGPGIVAPVRLGEDMRRPCYPRIKCVSKALVEKGVDSWQAGKEL